MHHIKPIRFAPQGGRSPCRGGLTRATGAGFGMLLAAGFGLASLVPLQAHDVVWWGNLYGLPGAVMDFYYPDELYGYVGVVPSTGEPCTVVVNLDSPSSSLVSAQVLPPNPENEVDILVQVLRAPNGRAETANITGEWHATGLPPTNGCDALSPNHFTVPVLVTNNTPLWGLQFLPGMRVLKIDTGMDCALQWASCLSGPWLNVGVGRLFDVRLTHEGYFQRLRRVGGYLGGYLYSPAGKPLSGIGLGLIYGGASAKTDTTGAFEFPRLPYGLNLLSLTNPIGASLEVELPSTNNTAVTMTVDMQAATGPATNACNCTPWCAIGFGSLPGGQTPVYYAGGANPPSSGAAACGQPEVTVTPPSGPPFTIRPGTSHRQNSGPNPAAGTWTVTTVVCGQTKTCSVTVP